MKFHELYEYCKEIKINCNACEKKEACESLKEGELDGASPVSIHNLVMEDKEILGT